ncbi:DUF179 domain-containing protein [Natronospirillum operosum]|uniref:UPF0301 protein E4656_15760 n=1 Tax=Natronospirillum operosum TaxID=2759953 RepID=A0A4Z0W5Z5_9GAMM|nr:YqgE/AlgH family protein [Natronospirillum operosum]TGG91484.1 DUF179 domain-containing protein [Natronospirillum operosum]
MSQSLSHHLLVAMPLLQDAFFARAVVYIVQHDDDGAMGIIVNKPVAMTQAELFGNLGIPAESSATAPPLVFGGPVMRERGFVLHGDQQEWESSVSNDHWSVTTSKDVLQAVAGGTGPARYQICLGYAGWGAGQLEQELASNAWLTVPARAGLVFDCAPYERYDAALSELGIDPAMLAGGGQA